MGKSPDTRIDEALGREICQRENVRALVTCDIASTGKQYALSSRLVEPQNGETVRAYLESVPNRDDVLAALGRIAGRLREDLGESLSSIRQNDRPLPQVTTRSLEALKSYVEARYLWAKGAYQEAVGLYQSALARDPDFALAHAALGEAYWSHVFNRPAQARQHFERALASADRITDRERLIIQASYKRSLGYVDEAVQLHKLYLTAYPDDSDMRYNLGTLLMLNHRLEEAIEQLREALRIAPTHARTLINLATSYVESNRAVDALAYYARAFELEPGWITLGNINHEYGFTLVHAGNLAKAREVFELAAAMPDMKVIALRSLALVDLYEGKYAQAKGRLQESILVSEATKDPLRKARNHLFMSILLDGQGDRYGQLQALNLANRSVEALRDPILPLLMRIGVGYSHAGAIVNAEQVLHKLRAKIDPQSPQQGSYLHILEGEMAIARGDHGQAIKAFLLADRESGTPETLAGLARAYDKANEIKQAIDCYQRFIAVGRAALGWEPQQSWIAAHARLAEIYLSRGQKDKAAQALSPLLRMWKEADSNLPLMKRILKLKNAMPPHNPA